MQFIAPDLMDHESVHFQLRLVVTRPTGFIYKSGYRLDKVGQNQAVILERTRYLDPVGPQASGEQ